MDSTDESAMPAPDSGVARWPVALTGWAVALLAILAAGLYAQRLEQERLRLQAQVATQERTAFELREQLTKAEVALQEKNAALVSRDIALAEATQPELPVRVSFRPAFMGQGMVASFQNASSEKLTLMVEFRDGSLHASRDFALVIEAGATADVGHAQGWLVNSGQSVQVSASGYRSVTAFAP